MDINCLDRWYEIYVERKKGSLEQGPPLRSVIIDKISGMYPSDLIGKITVPVAGVHRRHGTNFQCGLHRLFKEYGKTLHILFHDNMVLSLTRQKYVFNW